MTERKKDTMERLGRTLKNLYRVAIALLLLITCSAATFAWFTSNQVVKTDLVSGKSGTDSVELLISPDGGAAFRGGEESAIVQVNSTDLTNLMPVSTADLKTFVYAKGSNGDNATYFEKVENEKYYYHGRVYIQAKAESQPSGTRMNLYLEEGTDSGGALFQNASGDILNAGRLGLVFNQESSLIFKLTDKSNEEENRVYNTMIDGKVLGENQVLSMAGNSLQAVEDPAVYLNDYTISSSENDASIPDQSLFTMDLNQIYPVDIYFYMEGCDPDCSKSVERTGVNLHLAFYGVLAGGTG